MGSGEYLNQLVPAELARQLVTRNVAPTGHETVKISQASSRILAQDLVAKRTQPPFDASAMDGYAVRQEDITSLPTRLNVIGESRAGEPFHGKLEAGQAIRIFTGAVVPTSADSIIIQENTSTPEQGMVQINHGVEKGRFIRKAGLDFATGDVMLQQGTQLTPARLALAASMNHANISVHKRPVIALIATGDELVLPGENLSEGQIIASNMFGIAAMIENSGAQVLNYGIVADQKKALMQAFEQAVEDGADIVLTTGGASVGDHDLVMPVASECGFVFEISKIAMRPGKPFLFAHKQTLGKRIYLTGLAGNPVSSLVAFTVFVKPLIQKMNGQQVDALQFHTASLGKNLPANDQRADFLRAKTDLGPNGEIIATPFGTQDSSMLAKLVEADCLVYREVDAPEAFTGDPCKILPLS